MIQSAAVFSSCECVGCLGKEKKMFEQAYLDVRLKIIWVFVR